MRSWHLSDSLNVVGSWCTAAAADADAAAAAAVVCCTALCTVSVLSEAHLHSLSMSELK